MGVLYVLVEQKYPDANNRPVLIHGQVLREDQVDALRDLEVFPSLFPMHTFYWGDWHRESVLGPERAENISPTGWVLERGMMFGSHHDAPVALTVPPDPYQVGCGGNENIMRSWPRTRQAVDDRSSDAVGHGCSASASARSARERRPDS
jgi:hypothetical protein